VELHSHSKGFIGIVVFDVKGIQYTDPKYGKENQSLIYFKKFFENCKIVL